MVPPQPQFSPADLKTINESLGALNNMLPELDKAEAAGIDVAERRLARDNLYAFLDNLKKTYFPGKS